MAFQRRNGQLSSCEPCRKDKSRCDHQMPVCGRCAHRGQAPLCIYHPAPMTRYRPQSEKRTTARRAGDSRTWTRAETRQSYGENGGPSVLEAFASQDYETDVVVQNRGLSDGKKSVPSAPGWLGLTSPQGIFVDLESGLMHAAPEEEVIVAEPRGPIPVDPNQVALGVQVLQLLDDLPLYREICEARYAFFFKPWAFGGPFVHELFDNIHRFHQHGLREDNRGDMNELALAVFSNSRAPIIVHPDMNFTEYIGMIALRWEGIGLLFAITGASIYHIRGEHKIFLEREDGKPATDKRSLQSCMVTTAETCIKLCESIGMISEPLTWLLFQQTILASILWGNTDYRAWKMLGDASTMAFALGLHQPDPADKNAPFFLAELRKRVMAVGYMVDKQLATVLGRPPRISHRYCDLLLPSDLSYAEMIADPQMREAALGELDASGWNRQGLLSKAAHPRVGLLVAMLQENVLEVTSCGQIERLPQRIEELCDESLRIREQLPSFLQWKPSNGSIELSSDELAVQSIHLDFLYTEFLLYRISVKRTGVGSDKLVRVAHEILSTILDRIADIAKPDRAFSAMVPVDFSLCFYALPCAGVLSVELLRHSQSSNDPALSTTFNLPRVEIIQKLSIFVYFLETYVPPGQANYNMSQQARRVIRNILNEVLSSPQPMPASSSPTRATPDRMDETWLSAGDGLEFMSWLDTLDSGQSPWWNLT
ncbi:uncharacterized protein N7498_002123 [Penicillium cinerascens]|uniref:Zn(2)-C6 fungal-type domain-containing protein n=1 Tax=Penicillium cinerascens TaxID=70096 RepID=A0A9W9N9M0_9EURO|nr:uncharacterized protein N7498_002123 [Penicillium cinerascens]KAJ5215716.1 hypothetical protein N7498_002123 [Penicillium cinerascens]